jgi:hypothetical protein
MPIFPEFDVGFCVLAPWITVCILSLSGALTFTCQTSMTRVYLNPGRSGSATPDFGWDGIYDLNGRFRISTFVHSLKFRCPFWLNYLHRKRDNMEQNNKTVSKGWKMWFHSFGEKGELVGHNFRFWLGEINRERLLLQFCLNKLHTFSWTVAILGFIMQFDCVLYHHILRNNALI